MKIRTLAALTFFALLFVACKEDDLTSENPFKDPNNVIVQFSRVYGGVGYNPDSMITNIHGDQFFIDSVQVLASNFYIVDKQDTIDAIEPEIKLISTYNLSPAMAYLEPGPYSGAIKIDMGLDSLENANNSPNSTSINALKHSELYRKDKLGYNHFVIYGRLIDKKNDEDSTGSIPLLYKLGTPELTKTFTSERYNFAVDASRKVNLVFYLDLKAALHYLDLSKRPLIESDPTNTQDYNAAKTMLDSIKIGIF